MSYPQTIEVRHPWARKQGTGLHEHPEKVCPVCGGRGMLPDQKTGVVRNCIACKGTGRINRPIK